MSDKKQSKNINLWFCAEGTAAKFTKSNVKKLIKVIREYDKYDRLTTVTIDFRRVTITYRALNEIAFYCARKGIKFFQSSLSETDRQKYEEIKIIYDYLYHN